MTRTRTIWTVDIVDHSQFGHKQCGTRAFSVEYLAAEYGKARRDAFRAKADPEYRESIVYEIHCLALDDASF
jgi:hypothetical protein